MNTIRNTDDVKRTITEIASMSALELKRLGASLAGSYDTCQYDLIMDAIVSALNQMIGEDELNEYLCRVDMD